MRDAIAAVRPSCVEHFDALPELANALLYAEGRRKVRAVAQKPAPRLLEELGPLRTAMVGAVTALVARGLLDSQVLGTLRGGNNYGDMVHDMNDLTVVLLERWRVVEKRAPFTREEVEHAVSLTAALSEAAGLRPRADEAADELTLDRDRASLLLQRAYSQVRRVVTFLRWDEGDASELAPSLNPLGTRAPAAPAEGAPAEPVSANPAASELRPADPTVPQDSPFQS